MSDCCQGRTPEPFVALVCPVSGTKGKPVDVQTVKALLTEHALRCVTTSEHWFCPDPDCEVVTSRPAGVRVKSGIRAGSVVLAMSQQP